MLNFNKHMLRMNLKKTVILLISIYSPLGVACSCGEFKLEEYFTSCKHLFTATLYEAKVSKSDGSSVIGKFRNPEDVLAGIPSKIKGLKTTMMGTSCEVDLSVGKRYLVCGNDEEYIPISGCSLTTSTWWRNKLDELKTIKENLTNQSSR